MCSKKSGSGKAGREYEENLEQEHLRLERKGSKRSHAKAEKIRRHAEPEVIEATSQSAMARMRENARIPDVIESNEESDDEPVAGPSRRLKKQPVYRRPSVQEGDEEEASGSQNRVGTAEAAKAAADIKVRLPGDDVEMNLSG